MKSIILWLLGVPIVVIILLNVTGMLGQHSRPDGGLLKAAGARAVSW